MPTRSCRRLAAAFALSASVFSNAHAETLAEALAAAYKANPRLDAARATQRATDEELPRAIAGYRPSLTGSADAGWQKSISSPTEAGASAGYTPRNDTLHPRGYAVELTQPLFRGFRTVNAVSGAEATVRAGLETLRSTEQAVLLEAVTAYGDVVRDQAIVSLRENNASVLARDLEATTHRFRAGEGTRTDVAQAQARRASAVSALDLAKANLRSSRATYKRVVGHEPKGLRDPKPSSLIPKTMAESVDIAERESPTVVGALYREQVARFSVETIRGELLPTAQIESSYAKRFDENWYTHESETTAVTGRISVPVYTGGEVQARLRQAKHTHVQRLQEIEQARTEQQAQVVSAWAQLQAAQAALQSDRTAVRANETALNGVREEYAVGQRTLLDVLNAEQELLNGKVNLVTDNRNLLVASYTLLSAIGRLNAQELQLTGSIHDASAHNRQTRDKWFDISITLER